jgi:NAD(P)-dependent dehydrogenase (short-subunit alcohol dehydrogenase family)
MDLRLDGRVALVTGGSKGIGKAIAAAMVASGAKVMISSRKEENLKTAADEIGQGHPGSVEWFAANAGDEASASACIDATVERLGSLDILVNNAATNPHMGPITTIDQGRADKTTQVNLWGPLMWTSLAVKAGLGEGQPGSVVNVASVGGYGVSTSIGYYNVTKAGVIHLTRHLAVELAPRVRVNCLAPGLVKTDFARALWEAGEDAIAKRFPMKRLGEPEDIAGAAVFLASDAAGWLTGQTLVIDGGGMLAGIG